MNPRLGKITITADGGDGGRGAGGLEGSDGADGAAGNDGPTIYIMDAAGKILRMVLP